MNPDRLAALEEERRFLLRSLADLEREHDAGDVDEDDYRELRDGYTARAAATLRSIESGRAALAPKPSALPCPGAGVENHVIAVEHKPDRCDVGCSVRRNGRELARPRSRGEERYRFVTSHAGHARTLEPVDVSLDGDDELTIFHDDLSGVFRLTFAALEELLEESNLPLRRGRNVGGSHDEELLAVHIPRHVCGCDELAVFHCWPPSCVSVHLLPSWHPGMTRSCVTEFRPGWNSVTQEQDGVTRNAA